MMALTSSIYGLVGEKLSHSFSKIIHEKLADYNYELLPMTLQELDAFMTDRKFDGINVTIPYKLTVMQYCDIIDDSAQKIGAVNTIINQDGKLIGYNTDFKGFLYSLTANDIEITGKNVMILGTGGTCKTTKAVCEYLKAKKITIVSRHASDSAISYEQAYSDEFTKDTQVIINSTPIGMYPDIYCTPIDISQFSSLEAIADVIYNPLKTRLLLDAKSKGLKYTNGLQMLVAQAKYACELFLDKTIPDSEIDIIHDDIKRGLENIVLTGMPGCGKTTLGKRVASKTGKQFIDLDQIIEKNANMTIEQIFDKFGEAYFRKLEHETVKEYSKLTGLVISTGGGVILNNNNIDALSQNGKIIFIDRPIKKLAIGEGRPLSSNAEAVSKMYKERYPIYVKTSDIQMHNQHEASIAVKQLLKLIYPIYKINTNK